MLDQGCQKPSLTIIAFLDDYAMSNTAYVDMTSKMLLFWRQRIRKSSKDIPRSTQSKLRDQ